MKSCPLRTTVIGSLPFPGWLEFTSQNLGQFGSNDIAQAQAALAMPEAAVFRSDPLFS